MKQAIRELLDRIIYEGMTEDQVDEAARALARKYHIGDCEVWDVLANFEEAAA